MIDHTTYKKMLAGITPENLKEAFNVATFLINECNDENSPEISDGNKSLLIFALLIEYGKTQAGTERSETK